MKGKITLITPPDIFENENPSVLFIHLNREEQDAISQWLSTAEIDYDVNLYVYDNEPNASWIFYAMAQSEYKYINLNETNFITKALSGYVLGKSNTFYKVDDEELANVYSHINNNKIDNIEIFLERVLGGKRN